MTVLFAVYDNTGKCLSYCNARCYNAKPVSELKPDSHDPCLCACGGKNHAQGEIRALKNYQAGIGMQANDLKAFAKARGLACETLTVVDRMHVPQREAKRKALAHFNPKPLPLFGYGRLGGLGTNEGQPARVRSGGST